MKRFLIAAMMATLSLAAFAESTLTINAAEFGIGKFHRKDNKVHTYEANNAWKVFVLPEGVSTNTAYVQHNSADNYTIFFTSLEEFMLKTVELSQQTGKKVGMININAHGLPGGMWFPSTIASRSSLECASWRSAAANSDESNYDQYYSAVPKDEILDLYRMGNANSVPSFQCISGLPAWMIVLKKVPAFSSVFADNAQVHMLSCLVGMGPLGEKFTTGLAKLLFPQGGNQRVMTSIKLGLGDWSMPEGMGFWGYETDAQLEHDNEVYVINRRDSEIMQRGDIRVAEFASAGGLRSGLIQGENYMLLSHDDRVALTGIEKAMDFGDMPMPASVRLPGTNVKIDLRK